MFVLDRANRALLAAGAFAAFGAAFVTTPIIARGAAAGMMGDSQPHLAARAARTDPADVVPRRDPFAGGDIAAARRDAMPPQSHAAMAAMPALPPVPAALRALPPNAGAGASPFPFASGPSTAATVTAIVTGAQPFALIDDGGATRVLTVGDRIGGDTIAAIGTGGVRLTGGTVLRIAPTAQQLHGGP